MRMDIAQTDKGQWDTLWASGCWALWRERNRRLFTGKSKTVMDLVNHGTSYITKSYNLARVILLKDNFRISWTIQNNNFII